MSRNLVVADAVSGSRRASRSGFLRAGRMLAVLAALTALSALPTRAEAQNQFTIRPTAGAFVPTGDQRDLLEDAALVGVQAAYDFTPNFALIGTFGWAPSKDLSSGAEKIDIFQYDVGIEGRLRNLTPSSRISTRPYASLGVGGRTYDYRDLDNADAQTNFLGFGAVGVDLGYATSPVGLRLEARDNVTAFKGLRGELSEREARNDLQFGAGLTIAF